MTTVSISEKTKEKLDSLKVHPRETYDEVISRIITENKNGH